MYICRCGTVISNMICITVGQNWSYPLIGFKKKIGFNFQSSSKSTDSRSISLGCVCMVCLSITCISFSTGYYFDCVLPLIARFT